MIVYIYTNNQYYTFIKYIIQIIKCISQMIKQNIDGRV